MKLLIYGINYWPELTGVGKYTGEMAEWLASKGHDVQMITAPPYYPQWKVAEGYSAWWYKRKTHAGVRIQRCPTWVPQKLTLAHRLLHLFSFTASSAPIVLWKTLRWKPDLIITIQPPLITAPIVYVAARLAGAKTWMHIQDYELDAAFGLGMLSRPWLKQLLLRFERFFMRRFDRVSTISKRMMEQLSAKGVNDQRSVFFKNWVDTSSIFPLSGLNPFRTVLSIPNQHVIALYSGNMGRKQGLETLLDAARLLCAHSEIKIVLAGDGSMRSTLETMANDIPNVSFLPLQPIERLNDLLNLPDIHLLLQRPQACDFVMPSKLTGMLASGRPVIATVHPDSELAKTITGGSLIIPPEDPQALASAILDLAANPDKRKVLGKCGRQIAVSLFDKAKILYEFERYLTHQLGNESLENHSAAR